LLREALASIRALETDALRFEILVGDNGADPKTRAVVEELGAVHIPVSKAGAGAARNAALRAAQGPFIAFLDDDDVWTRDHVRNHLALLDADPALDAVFGRVTNVDEALNPSDTWPEAPGDGDDLVRNMLSGYYPQIGATIVRASVRESIGWFDESLFGDQDWDWQLRLARRRRVAFAPTVSVLFRQRPGGSYDRLRLQRIGFGRRVFFRHAIPEYRLWSSFKGMMDAYKGVMWQYYQYFYDAAGARADAGAPRAEVLRAIWGAARTFPLRTARDLIGAGPLQHALRRSFGRR
jgi:glycosyltransferase involved in cell wall biosynthesis